MYRVMDGLLLAVYPHLPSVLSNLLSASATYLLSAPYSQRFFDKQSGEQSSIFQLTFSQPQSVSESRIIQRAYSHAGRSTHI